jgi:hypothetical protein
LKIGSVSLVTTEVEVKTTLGRLEDVGKVNWALIGVITIKINTKRSISLNFIF